MSAHTPGPWQILELDSQTGDVGIYQCAPHFHEVAYVARRFHGERDMDEEALNAQLIAAAPDMLALLRELIDMESPMGQPGTARWGAKVQAVIAKATAP